MELGLSSYTYGWAIGAPDRMPVRPMTEQDLLDRALSHGVKLLQVCDNLPLNRLPTARFMDFVDRAAREGVRLEVGSRGLTPGHVTEMAELARRARATLARFVIDAPDFHPPPAEVVRILREVDPHLDGLQIGLENHDRFTANTLRKILEAVDSDRVGICLDTANSLGAGEGLETVLDQLAPFVVNLHIKDFSITRLPYLMGFTVEGAPCGTGMLDVPSLLSKLSVHGRCHTAVLEQWAPPAENLERTIAREEAWAAQSVDYLRKLF